MIRAARRSALRSPLTLARVLVDLALVVVVGFGLSGVVLGRIVPALGHPVYVVAGPSMEPTIHLGSAVLLDPVAPSALAVDDVVSLRSGPSRAVFTHRIIRVALRDGAVWIETKGDANAEPDPAISPATDVIGRVTTVVPYAGYALTLLSAPAGVMLVLSVGATLMVLGWSLDSVGRDPRPSRARGAVRPTRGAAPSAGASIGLARTLGLATAAFAPPGSLALAVVGPAPGAASRAAVHLATLPGVSVAGSRASATDRASTTDRPAATDPAASAEMSPAVTAPATDEAVPATPTPKASSRVRRPRTAPTAAASTSTPTRRRTRAAARATP